MYRTDSSTVVHQTPAVPGLSTIPPLLLYISLTILWCSSPPFLKLRERYICLVLFSTIQSGWFRVDECVQCILKDWYGQNVVSDGY